MRRKQFLALILCVSMLGSTCLGGCGQASYAKAAGQDEISTQKMNDDKNIKTENENTAEEGSSIEETSGKETEESKILHQVVSSNLANENNATKKETVYVKADASGKVKKTIVSEWLKNVEHVNELHDQSVLKNIENVMGDETYTEKNGELIWNSNGNDIYYQGTCDKALPVEVQIEYVLDGKEMKPEELAGKSGHLDMHFHYINHEKASVKVGDQMQEVYVPFVAVSGVILDDQVFQNIEITNGTIMNDASRQIAVGMAFPGLVESLNHETEDEMLQKLEEEIKLPDSFTISCEVKNFKMGMTLTMISSDIFSSLGLGDLEDDGDVLAELKSSMGQLDDAGDALVEGTGKLKDGAGKLQSGAGELKNGSEALYGGIVAYTDGVGQVASGAGALRDGTGKLNNGIAELKNGSAGLATGAVQIESGAIQVNDGANQVKTGAEAVNIGAGNLKSGIDNLCAGSSSLKSGLGQLQTNTPALVSGIAQVKDGASKVDAGAGAVSDGVGKLVDSLITAKAGLTGENGLIAGAEGVHQILSGMDASLKASYNSNLGSDTSVIAGMLQSKMQDGSIQIDETTGKMCMSSDTMNELLAAAGQVGANQVIDQLGGYVTQADGIATAVSGGLNSLNEGLDTDQLKTLKQGAIDLKTGTKNLADGAGTLNTSVSGLTDGVNSLYNGAVALDNGALALQTGAETLVKGTDALAKGAGNLAAGTDTLAKGTTSLKNGAGTLDAGVGELQNGSCTLKNGMDSLAGGIATIVNNSDALKNGSRQLSDGAAKLENGTGELIEGIGKYDEGMREFKQKGIDKLTNLLDNDSTLIADKLKALNQAAKGYRSYAGENKDGASVKFLIETEAIK